MFFFFQNIQEHAWNETEMQNGHALVLSSVVVVSVIDVFEKPWIAGKTYALETQPK